MTRIVARENSQAAEDKDPKAVRPDVVGKRRLAEHIVEDRKDPTKAIEERMLQEAANIVANDVIYGDDSAPSNEFQGLEKIKAERGPAALIVTARP